MKQAAAEVATNSVGDWLTWLLLALGVTFSGVEYLGGLLFALALAMLTRNWWPEKDKREIWVVLVSAWLVSTIGAELFYSYFTDTAIPAQMIMALLGLASRIISNFAMQFMLRFEQRTPEAADRAVSAGLDRVLGPDDRKNE